MTLPVPAVLQLCSQIKASGVPNRSQQPLVQHACGHFGLDECMLYVSTYIELYKCCLRYDSLLAFGLARNEGMDPYDFIPHYSSFPFLFHSFKR